MKNIWSTVLLSAAFGCGHQSPPSSLNEHWDTLNDPARFGITTVHYQRIAASGTLPQHGGAGAKLWSGHSWSTNHGGIAHRWQRNRTSTNFRDYLFNPLTGTEASQLSEFDLNRLSPAEKFDLFKGRANFPLTRAEQQLTLSSVVGTNVPSWRDISNGWAAASTQELSPGAYATVQLADGRNVTFYSHDIEALLAKTYSNPARYQTRTIGTRCTNPAAPSSGVRPIESDCRDANPASFHLLLHDAIVRRGVPFILDRGAGISVSNVPVFAYSFRYSNLRPSNPANDPDAATRAPGTAFVVDVSTQVKFATSVGPKLSPMRDREDQHSYSYSLDLNNQGIIIGGEWISAEHPDILWDVATRPDADPAGLIDYIDVRQLLDMSQGTTTLPPWPMPTPGPAPTPGSGIPADGSPEARAVLNFVNVAARSVLVERVRISEDAADRIEAMYNGPDGEMSTGDDRPYVWMSQLLPLVTRYELQLLINYAMYGHT